MMAAIIPSFAMALVGAVSAFLSFSDSIHFSGAGLKQGPLLNLDLVPLSEAVYCEDCRLISRSTGHCCASCQSASVLNLSRVLNRSEILTKDPLEALWELAPPAGCEGRPAPMPAVPSRLRSAGAREGKE